MKTAYVIIKAFPFMHPYQMVEVHLDESAAEQRKVELNNSIPDSDKPEYDDYGLIEGYDYVIVDLELK
jgi:hypothetical protein